MKKKSNLDAPVYWTMFVYDEWKLYMAASSVGLCYLSPQNKQIDELVGWTKRHFPNSLLIQDDDKLQRYLNEIIEFFEGKRADFTLPLDLRGTPFQQDVWYALRRIPFGHTKSYSDIAIEIQKPSSVRAVGTAIGANPILITVPCHRVIGKNGSLTGYRGGLDMKAKLLQLEKEFAILERSSAHA
ncbi:methylated-DNA--[protein]-cysteine S-methyltransferase [Salipaludibacillus sp. HK11]|uniref:methylated-DNA--[protein]-cysteine S-methyltransferase n=1 Tax=Salipaludibacillus sp. HK11 TaxID=3394320 RepID=UPI0039FD5466